MADQRPFSRLLDDVRNLGVAARDVIARRLPRAPLGVVLYDSFAANDRALIHGRALRDERLGASAISDPKWRNLVAMLKRADSDPIPHAVVRVRAGSATQDFASDDEGYFQGWMPCPDLERADDEWGHVSATLVSPPSDPAVVADAKVLRPVFRPELLVVSDIDDTVLQSRVTSLFAALRTMMLENAHTRLPFPGVAAFYRALRRGRTGAGRNPTFYVSSSPWNVYDVITQFLEIQGIPHGPVLLRDVDLSLNLLGANQHHNHKREMIRRVLTTYHDIAAVLIGDSGQQDPEIYRDVVHEFRGRIRAIYIRDVSADAERSRAIQQLAEEVVAAGSSLVLAPDTLAAASHAVEAGLIHESALAEVREEKKADES